MSDVRSYLKGCEICNAGLIKRAQELMDEGMTLNAASKEISIEITKSRGGVYLFSPESIRNRVRLHTGKREPHPNEKVGHGDQPKAPKDPVFTPDLDMDSEDKSGMCQEEREWQDETERLSEEFARREKEWEKFFKAMESMSAPFPAELKPMLAELTKIGYRALALKYHPDKTGGSADAMAKLNNVKDFLDELAK